MPTTRSIADLFGSPPAQWNLRGDPHLWREMAETFGGVALPDTAEQLRAELERVFELLTGQPTSFPEPIFLERHSHGGMSSGYISTEFWREVLIPLLVSRFVE